MGGVNVKPRPGVMGDCDVPVTALRGGVTVSGDICQTVGRAVHCPRTPLVSIHYRAAAGASARIDGLRVLIASAVIR